MTVLQESVQWHRETFHIDTDFGALDLAAVHQFLSDAPWSRGMPIEILEQALRHSLCFSLFQGGRQIGVARVITDFVTYAYLCDVFVVAEFRAQGLGSWLIRCVLMHPQLEQLRRVALLTVDAQGFYRRFGFECLSQPQRYMERIQAHGFEGLAVERAF